MMQSPQTPPIRSVSPLQRYQSAGRCALPHEPEQPLPGLNEIKIVLGVASCAWLFLALATFNPTDPSFFTVIIPAVLPTNWCGTLGAYCASWLFVLCGTGAWLVTGMVLMSILPQRASRWYHKVVTVVAAASMVASVAMLDALFGFSASTGGIVGRTCAQHADAIGTAGCGLIAGTVLFFSTLIFTRCSVSQFVSFVRFGLSYGMRVVSHGISLVMLGASFIMPRSKNEQEKNERGEAEIVIHSIPETEVAPHSVHTPLHKQPSEHAIIEQHEIAEAAPAHTKEEAYSFVVSEVEEEEPVAYGPPAVKEEDVLFSAPAVEEDDEALLEEEEESEDDDDDTNDSGSGSGGGGDRGGQRYFEDRAAVVEDDEAEDDGPAVYTMPASFHLPRLEDIFPNKSNLTQDPAFIERCRERGQILEEKLSHFGITGRVCNIKPGPVITLFEYEPEVGNKVSRILALEDDLALSLKALSIRILAPIPGKSVVGFEIANEKRNSVMFGDVIGADGLAGSTAHLPLALGVDIVGNPVIADLAAMPHLLVAGATGSGKSVGMNVMLVSLLARVTPDKARIILIDPKRLEFTPYADIPHLLFPIITNPMEVAPVLKWVAEEMELRYELMAQMGVRNIAEYHKLNPVTCFTKEREVGIHIHGMPYIVVMIDELADLMMVGGREIETLIARIAQMARAAGIHMLVATQRPSVDVVTGLIKANFPSRIAFRVSTKIDSRTIIDSGGAEKLLGRGDMLYMSPASMFGLQRLHGAYLTDVEIDRLTAYLKGQRSASYFSLKQVVAQHSEQVDEYNDPLYEDVCQFIGSVEEISISLLQRKYRVGFNRSARLIEMLERDGYVAAAQGGKPRRVLRD